MRRTRRRWALTVLVLFLGVTGLVMRARRPLLDQPIPTPVMPSPNARDFYVRATELQVDKTITDYAFGTPTPGGPPPPSPAQIAAAVEHNAAALAELRRGFAYPYLEPPARSFAALFPHYGKFRGLERLLSAKARLEAQRGDYGAAVDTALEGLHFGIDIPHGGNLIGDLVGISCQAIARWPAWDYIDHLTAAEARDDARRLAALLGNQIPYRDVVTEEKWCALAGTAEIFGKRGWVRGVFELTGSDSYGPALALKVALRGRRGTLKDLAADCDRFIAWSAKPYATRGAVPKSGGGLSDLVLPVLGGAACKHADSEAENALFATALALRAHSAEHGAYPDRLEQLVPADLPRVPADPFGAGEPLRYRRDGAKYLLWSIGPDGKDDGGKPVNDTTKTGRARYYVLPDSRGDIVAGVNL